MEIELDENTFVDCNLQYLNKIPVIDCDVSYNDFFKNYLLKNQACVVKNVTRNWNSFKKWVSNDLPNFSYLKSKYGEDPVNIQNCNDQDYNASKYEKWKCSDYLRYWEEFVRNGYPKDTSLYYLKDWHMQNEHPSDNIYEVPLYFASDWINEYLVENMLDDYRFVYMGAMGTWTPFHVDVMTSYSWSTNICGKKKWLLFPPGEEKHFLTPLGSFPPDVSEQKTKAKYFEIIQNPGDAVYVPSNWHHQVWNIKNTISINHNWINGTNIKNIWCTLDKNLSEVKQEINDCKDMENFLDHCQLMLKASFGMNFVDFYKFIMYIACKRLKLMESNVPVILPENRILGKNHAIYDLNSLKHVLELFIDHNDVFQLDNFNHMDNQPAHLLQRIQKALV